MVCCTKSIRYHVRGALLCVTKSETRMGRLRYTVFMTLPMHPVFSHSLSPEPTKCRWSKIAEADLQRALSELARCATLPPFATLLLLAQHFFASAESPIQNSPAVARPAIELGHETLEPSLGFPAHATTTNFVGAHYLYRLKVGRKQFFCSQQYRC